MRVFALWIALAAPQDPKGRYDYLVYEALRYFWEERLPLADWAKANGLNREARSLLEFMVQNMPGSNPWKSKAQNKLVGAWKRQPNKADAKKMADYQRRLREYFSATADRFWAAYTWAKSRGMEKEAADSLGKTVQYFIDHEKARQERGEVKVEAFGWVPQAEAELMKRNLVDLDKLPADDASRGAWDNPWFVSTKRYIIRSDVAPGKIREVAEALEKLYAEVTAFAAGAFPEPPTPLGVYFFRRREDYDVVRKTLPGLTDVPAFFHGMTNIAYVRSFRANSAREGGGLGTEDLEMLLHECTHQVLDMGAEGRICSLFQSANSRAAAEDNYWAVEGIAIWFGCRGNDAWRAAWVKTSELPKLADFCAMNYEQFMRDPTHHYAIAYMLCRYLLERDRKRFIDFLREYYLGNGTMATFSSILGAKPEELEKGFLEWVRK